VLDGLAAVVNDDVITFSQVRELVAAREQTLRETLKGQALADKVKEVRLAAVNDLIDRQLVVQEFDKNKFSIPEFAVDDHINTIIREQFASDRQAFIRALQAQGYTIQKFRKAEADKMKVQALRSRNVKVTTILSPIKIEDYYEAHRLEFSIPEQVKLRMIVLHTDSPDAQGTASTIRSKVKNVDDFSKMAAMYSEDSSKNAGGDWGWVDRSTLDKSLSDPAFALKVGRVSKVLEVSGNYYLLFVEARKKAEVKPVKEVHDDIAGKVLQAERAEAQEKWIKGLRAKAYVKIF
jgi:peptidyl-prolyl cis-trans isomerase SurA